MGVGADEELILMTKSTERWNCIDESIGPEFKVECEPSDLASHIKIFEEFSAKYGPDWTMALKLRIYGSEASKTIKIKLRDLGLVPLNYIGK